MTARVASRAGLALLLLLAAAGPTPAGLRAGDRLPDVTLPDAEDRPVPLHRFAGRVLVVDFWATWCAPCKAALPALDALARRYRDAGLTVVAVSVDRDPALARRFLEQLLPRTALVVLHDTDGAVLARVGAPGMPATVVVGRDGTIAAVTGGWDDADVVALERRIEALLATSR